MWFPPWLRTRNPSVAGKCDRRCGGKAAAFRPRLEALEGRDVPSTLTVTNTNDSGKGSLRAEIALAKNNNATIVFDPRLDGSTITLTSGELDITSNLTIQGPGSGQLTVSGGGTSRVFEVAAKMQATLSGLKISNGSPFDYLDGTLENGGGILNHGTLTVSGCTLSGNTAEFGGGAYNGPGGTLTLSGCTLSGNTAEFGGGVFNYYFAATLTLSGCTLSGNTADTGGGVCNQGNATLRNCTLTGNFADGWAGEGGVGGGIDNGGAMTVSNCTLSRNFCDAVGGGIFNNGTLTVTGSAFIGNSEFGPSPDNISGPYVDGGGNTFG